jgi:site-specific DNA recombinase
MDMIKAAIYARVSTEAQSENSTTDQVRECQSYIEKEGWLIYGVYIDDAISGADVTRAEYNRLKGDAASGNFNYIVVDDLSRIGRDMPEFAKLYQELYDSGVYIIGVADGIDTSKASAKIPVYFKGIMNELYLDDMKAKVVRGLKGQLLRGYSTGGRIYGYKTEPIYDPAGTIDKFGRVKRYGCRISKDEAQVKIIKRIFDLRKSGLGYRAIAHMLNAEEIPPPRADTISGSRHWSPGTIRDILRNKKYIGIWEYNKIRWIKKRVKGSRRSIQNRPSDWVVFNSEELRIVSDELFYQVNSEIRTHMHRNPVGKKKYLLSGLLVCAECGGTMIIQNARKYSSFVCSNARNKGKTVCRNTNHILRSQVEESFMNGLRNSLLNSGVIPAISARTNEIVESALVDRVKDVGQLLKEKKVIERQIENLLNLAQDGDLSPSIRMRIQQKESDLQRTKIEIEYSREKLEKPLRVSLDWIERKFQRLDRLILDRTSGLPALRNELLKLFPGKLVVEPYRASQGIEFHINGNASPFNWLLADNLQLCMASPRGFEPLLPP